jgi:hypothetical protein
MKPRPMLRCCCCGEVYERGRFRCCAPPNGMKSEKWLELACPMPPRGCGKCAKHCACPSKVARLGEGPLASLGRQFLSQPVAFLEQLNQER